MDSSQLTTYSIKLLFQKIFDSEAMGAGTVSTIDVCDLFIAKSIVEAHGGTIRADSDGAGKGSTFTAEFPVV